MSRFSELQALLAREGLDALMLTSPVARFFATGLQTSDGLAVITREAGWFFTDFRYIEAARNKVSDFAVEMTSAAEPYAELLRRSIEGKRVKKLGFEADTMTVSAHKRWSDKLKCELVPCDAALRALRAVKLQWEVDRIVAAQRIAERALEEVLGGVLRPGITEKRLAAELTYRMLRNGSERDSFDPIVVSGPNSSMPHGVPGDREIREGDFVTMDFGATTGGYVSDMTRTVAVGAATDEMRAVYEIVLRAQQAGIDAARAGVPGRDIDAAARGVIASAGYGEHFGHGFGHGLGIEVHEQPGAGPNSQEPLPEGAVISAEPGIYLPGRFGVRIEDMLRLTKDGCENLTAAPKELIVVGVQ